MKNRVTLRLEREEILRAIMRAKTNTEMEYYIASLNTFDEEYGRVTPREYTVVLSEGDMSFLLAALESEIASAYHYIQGEEEDPDLKSMIDLEAKLLKAKNNVL